MMTIQFVHRRFEQEAARRPAAIAVVSETEELTYRELNRRANLLAAELQEANVGPESIVGVALERGASMVVAILAVLKAGGAYLPLDPAYPDERLAFMLADAGVRVLLTERGLMPHIPAETVRPLFLDRTWPAGGAANPDLPLTPEDLAYVIYTSGSSGTPKGVLVEHRGLCNLADEQIRTFAITPESQVLQFASCSFDASVSEIFATLLAGATLHLAPREQLMGPALAGLLRRRRITVATLPPAVLALLSPADVEGLRTLVSAGDACPADVVDRLAPGRRFINAYGPTEATVCATMAVCAAGEGRPPIGRPIGGAAILLLDEAGVPVPDGAPGEIYIGGIGVARGYLNRPGLTAERFVTGPGGRLYRTGDLARRRPDGQYEFLGRLDRQVKIRGFRIEPDEVEAVLAGHPRVREAAVAAHPDERGELRLVAYIVPDAGGWPGSAAFREYLGRRLPAYMIPGAYVQMEALPLTPSGKVDRKALPEPPAAAGAGGDPRTPLEARLAAIWADVLGCDRVGVDDDFLEIGGHSLRAAQILARIRTELGADLPLPALFAAPTVAALAVQVEAAMAGGGEAPIKPAARDGALPLSFSQERVWFLQELSPAMRAYHAQALLRFLGDLDVAVLERALSEIVRRHEIFRTTFRSPAGRPVQEIHQPWPVALAVTDLSALPAGEREAEARRLTDEAMTRPFDPAVLPLVHWVLLRMGPQEHHLLHIEHHFVHDGWSFGVFMHELKALYTAFLAGEPSPLPPLAIQYADYAVWQRRWLEGEEAARQLAYWKAALAGLPPALHLPADRPRPAVQSFRGAAVRIGLDGRLSDALRELGRREGTTLFMTLLAGFVALLHRYTREDDICVGSGIANRRRRETEPLMGMIINTVALRTDLGGSPTFRDLLGRVRQTTLGAYANQDLPFDRVVDALRPDRSRSFSPIYQAVFSFHDTPMPDLRLPGVTVDVTEGLNNGSAKFDLNVIAIPRLEQCDTRLRETAPGRIEFIWEYSADLFDEATIRRMAAHYAVLLEAAAADPARPVGELPLLTPAEAETVLVAWNGARAAFPTDRLVHELVAQQAALQPDAPAVAIGSEPPLTYGELERRANRLARHLQRLGAGPGVPVAICCERSPDFVTGLMAILKAGAAYLPLDPAYPPDRLAYMLANAGAPLLLTRSDLLDRLPPDGPAIFCLDRDWGALADESAEPLPRTAGVSNLAYIIYTSGSTGAPKGVEVEHGSLLNLLHWFRQAFPLGPGDRSTHLSGTGFDATILELWPALTAGACLHIPPDSVRISPPDLRHWLDAEGITHSFLPTPLAERILALPGPAPARLRRILTGGDQLHHHPAAPLGFDLYNLYGPTEYTVVTTAGLVPVRPDAAAAPSIGRPLPNTRVYLLDAKGGPVPVGVPGELHIAGAGLARGYRNQPGLTAERFVTVQGERAYRTGDMARWLPDGTLEFLGRADGQVKIRGLRIELGEIEAVLGRHPAVRECAVAAPEDDRGEKRLVGYVVPAAAAPPDPGELRRHLRAKLPEFMVPPVFVILDQLPLTPNGKVDRRALPLPLPVAETGEADPPAGPVETAVAEIWAEVLGTAPRSRHDSFFALGGHSLQIARVLARVAERFGVQLPVSALYAVPTVAELAEQIGESTGGQAAIPRRPAGAPTPAAFGQQGLWLVQQLAPQSPAYHIPLAFRLRGRVDAAALERALQAVVGRHESLRTTFTRDGARLMQVVHPTMPVPFQKADLRQAPDSALRLAAAAAAEPFDLAAGPLLRSLLIRTAEAEYIWVVAIHHLVFDGWSLDPFLWEVEAGYAGTGSLPPLAVQYADWAVWQRRRMAEGAYQNQLAAWQERLRGLETVELLTDRPRPGIRSWRGAKHVHRFGSGLSERLAACARAEGVTLYVFLLAAFQVLLSRSAGQTEITVGTAVAGRGRSELDRLIGFFVNTLVIRGDLSDHPSFRQLLQRVKETVGAALRDQELPFDQLVEALQPERDLSRTVLYQVMFTLQNASESRLGLAGVQAEPLLLDLGAAQTDLTFSLEPGPDGLRAVIQYDSELFDLRTVAALADHYTTLLEAVTADLDRPVGALPLLTAAEATALAEWQEAPAAYPRAAAIDQLFAEVAAARPDAVAILAGELQMTYGELHAASNRLARFLIRRGVQPGSLVGISVERSAAMVTGLLAILKAGAAYVPLDPEYPPDRLAFMLADAGAALVLTESRLAARFAGMNLLCLDRDAAAIAAEPEGDLPGLTQPLSAAYVIYTSGSTGRPKGVVVPHRGVVRLVRAANYADLTADDVFLQLAPVSFDASTLEIWGALLNGGRLALMPPGTPSLEELAAAIRRFAVTVLWLTAGLFHLMVEQQLDALLTVRQILAGGDVLSAPHVRRVLERLGPEGRLINGYGPTENTTFTCCFPMTRQTRFAGSVPIGRPIAGTRVLILDRNLEPVPAGAPGELYAGGDGLALGYLNRPDLTAERFVTVRGERFYRTGDLTRWLPDGTIEFLGRTDRQVKIRGFRVEPGEIEEALKAWPAVRAAAVIDRADGPGGKQLVAYVVAEPGAALPTPAQWKAELRERMPAFLVPAAFVTLDAFPLTPNGKVDRAALPAPDWGGERPAPAALTPLQSQVAAVFAEVLGQEQIGPDDDFFELGGHSLAAVQTISRMADVFGVRLSLQALFAMPTVAGVAAELERTRAQGAADAAEGRIRRVTRTREDELLEELDQLSDEDVAALLAGLSGEEEKP